MTRLINIDNGGTLTDICVIDGDDVAYTKTLTTPFDLSRCLFDGLTKASAVVYGEERLAALPGAHDALGSRAHLSSSITGRHSDTLASVEVEVPTVDELVSAAAAVVSTRLSDVTDDLVELLTREIEPLRGDARIESLLSASVAENLATLLHMFEHGIDPQSIEAPAAAV